MAVVYQPTRIAEKFKPLGSLYDYHHSARYDKHTYARAAARIYCQRVLLSMISLAHLLYSQVVVQVESMLARHTTTTTARAQPSLVAHCRNLVRSKISTTNPLIQPSSLLYNDGHEFLGSAASKAHYLERGHLMLFLAWPVSSSIQLAGKYQ